MLGSPTFCALFDYGYCACDAIFGLNLRPQIGGALADRWIGHGLADGRRKPLNRQFAAGYRFWPNPQFGYALPPKRLIPKEGDHNGRNPGPETGGCCPRASVMDDRRDAREKPGKGDRVHHEYCIG
jgi:hypothetical protein